LREAQTPFSKNLPAVPKYEPIVDTSNRIVRNLVVLTAMTRLLQIFIRKEQIIAISIGKKIAKASL
jgi:hypothetical protein